MPKINVYLPDDLAEAVKQAGVPVSSICQRALEQAVRRVTAIRETALSDVDLDRPTGALTLLTPRTRTVLKLAAARAGAGGVETEHLLAGMLAEGTNLALHVLRAMDIDPGQVTRDLAGRMSMGGGASAEGRTSPGSRASAEGSTSPESRTTAKASTGPGGAEGPDSPGGRMSSGGLGAGQDPGGEPGRAAGSEPEPGSGPVHEPGAGEPGSEVRRFGVGAANALEAAVNEATSLGHNYVGCEHLLLGLVAEPDGIAGQVLRGLGAEPRPTRRAVVAALAGYVHLRAESAAQPSSQTSGQSPGAPDLAALVAVAVRQQLQPLVQRIARLEEHLGPASGD
ncbi:Clp protease N-terminal domain-containing protein [Nonomuraea sp. C10]|uniref:Clp protease N-terminal domain-containing protein n=1 Tax=Nonomuraea sp. C10 TaxID=2600577 RepID=UPI0011CE41C9|nr:Clp protease N-terminal domain-containing protein [Nonomuraea sp. C10]TXK41286.1 ATP-dependent Clp protease ATP-binding subunit [Nonomuraea sp. C10]